MVQAPRAQIRGFRKFGFRWSRSRRKSPRQFLRSIGASQVLRAQGQTRSRRNFSEPTGTFLVSDEPNGVIHAKNRVGRTGWLTTWMVMVSWSTHPQSTTVQTHSKSPKPGGVNVHMLSIQGRRFNARPIGPNLRRQVVARPPPGKCPGWRPRATANSNAPFGRVGDKVVCRPQWRAAPSRLGRRSSGGTSIGVRQRHRDVPRSIHCPSRLGRARRHRIESQDKAARITPLIGSVDKSTPFRGILPSSQVHRKRAAMDNHVHGVGARHEPIPPVNTMSHSPAVDKSRRQTCLDIRVELSTPQVGPCTNPILGLQLKVVAPALAKGERVVAQHNVPMSPGQEALVNATRGHVVIARTWFRARQASPHEVDSACAWLSIPIGVEGATDQHAAGALATRLRNLCPRQREWHRWSRQHKCPIHLQ